MRLISDVNSLEISLIESASGLEQIRHQWHDLWHRCPAATPFQSPDWLLPWWSHFGNEGLLLLTARNQGRLVGIGPFFIYRADDGGNTLCFLGTGISDYLDIIAEPGMESAVVDTFLSFLADLPRWDKADLQDLRPDSPLLSASTPAGLKISGSILNTCSYLELPANPQILLSRLPGKLRRNIRHCLRELEKTGQFTIRVADQHTVSADLEQLFALHGKRWASRQEPGVLSMESVQTFHRQAAPRLLDSNSLRLCSVNLNDTPISIYYSMIKDSVAYIYLGGFDPSCERFSPGSVGLYCTIVSAIQSGAKIADLLRGEEMYKSLWGVKRRANCKIEITRK